MTTLCRCSRPVPPARRLYCSYECMVAADRARLPERRRRARRNRRAAVATARIICQLRG